MRGQAVLGLAAPIERWDEGLPLGNGLLGGLLWGGAQGLNLSLDRGDLWDLRPAERLLGDGLTWARVKQLVDAGQHAGYQELVDKPFQLPYPTKLPAGRLVFQPRAAGRALRFELDLRTATGVVRFGQGTLEAYFSAVEPLLLLRAEGLELDPSFQAPQSLAQLGYGAGRMGQDSGALWYLQEAALGLRYALCLCGGTGSAGGKEWALAIEVTRDGSDPLAVARQRAEGALGRGYRSLRQPHLEWWDRFWSASRVQVPAPALQEHYELVQYLYGAGSRRGAPPLPLQGVWTADEGALPPWKGDYHHDLNTQLTYGAYLAAGHFEEGLSFLDFMWDLLPRHRRYAREFFETPGAAVPGVMGLDGSQLGGWSQYSLSPVNGAWVAHAFYLYWRYTLDRRFLVERALPYLSEIGTCLAALLRPGPDGRLKLPLSSSPEIHNDKPQAWLKPNSNYDQALLRWLFAALAELHGEAGDAQGGRPWLALQERLGDLAVSERGVLELAPGEPLTETHRHPSHLLAIHPLGLLTIEGGARERQLVEASLNHYHSLGTRRWTGYSFSWHACMNARCGRSAEALRHLEIYLQAFLSRNGFHLNGDTRQQGYSEYRYRPFTLEGNFVAAEAVQEMLLQGWGGVLRIFPAVPEQWRDASFENLRAEGALRVSAERAAGRTVRVLVRSAQGGLVRLRDPFGGDLCDSNRPGLVREGSEYRCQLAPGEEWTLRRRG